MLQKEKGFITMRKITYQNLRKRLARTALLACSLIPAAFLSGCGKSEESSTSATTGSTPLSSTAELTTEEPTTEVPEAALFFKEHGKRLSDSTALYDINEVLPKKAGFYISDFAVTEDDKLLILYVTEINENMEAFYSITSLDMATGDTETLIPDTNLDTTGIDMVGINVKFKSLDPLILYDSTTEIFYNPVSGNTIKLEHDTDKYVFSVFSANGSLYYIMEPTNVYRVNETADGFSTEFVGALPSSYSALNPVSSAGDNITFLVRQEWNLRAPQTYVTIDAKTFSVTDAYTLEEGKDETYFGYNYRARIKYPSDENGKFFLQLIFPDSTGYHLVPLGDDSFLQRLSDSTLWPEVGMFALNDKYFFFSEAVGYCESNFYFWDLSEYERTAITGPEHFPHTIVEINDDSVNDYRKDIEERTGIQILIKDDYLPEVTEYDITRKYDNNEIYSALTMIDTCYSMYPSGFFEQLAWSDTPFRIGIVDSMFGNQDGTVSSAGGLATGDENGSVILLASFDSTVIFHETTHVIYDKLLNDGFMTDGSDEWNALNPPDFEYGFTYDESELPNDDYTADMLFYVGHENDIDQVYFNRAYSKTYMTEDLADLMSNLMDIEGTPAYYKSSRMRAKCLYFFNKLREGFDTTGWPEQTEWEKRLAEFDE